MEPDVAILVHGIKAKMVFSQVETAAGVIRHGAFGEHVFHLNAADPREVESMSFVKYKEIILRFIVILTSLIATFGANANELENVVEQYVGAIFSYNCEQIAELVHPDDLSLFQEKVDNALQSPNKDLVNEELLPLLGVDSRQQAAKLTAKESYSNLCTNLTAKLPTQELKIANAEIEHLKKTTHGDIVVVTYKVTYELGGKSTYNISQYSFKKYQDSWRILLTPESLAYFEQYT
ncbi:hypothetical protein [Vibrio renipiscarius]|uniref:hypothetical protein n=1 Tax=Vibrio renipiscarius TaxID=1461322 RepID=UPI001F3CDEFC|nr:hypothetical protein [Vibrio renipiscarius]